MLNQIVIQKSLVDATEPEYNMLIFEKYSPWRHFSSGEIQHVVHSVDRMRAKCYATLPKSESALIGNSGDI